VKALSLSFTLSLVVLAAGAVQLLPRTQDLGDLPAVDLPVDASCELQPGWVEAGGSGPLRLVRRLVERLPDGFDPERASLQERALAGTFEVVDAALRVTGSGCEILAVEPLHRTATVEELVHAVGQWPEGEPLLVYHLARTPRASVRALVDALDPLREGPADEQEARHMARMVVALEAITGRSFAFYPLKISRNDPCFSADDPAGYWGYRMGWARMCLAPPFERLRVVNAWRDWAEAEGDSFEPVPLDEITPPLLP
jgi:hypothetical protein